MSGRDKAVEAVAISEVLTLMARLAGIVADSQWGTVRMNPAFHLLREIEALKERALGGAA